MAKEKNIKINWYYSKESKEKAKKNKYNSFNNETIKVDNESLKTIGDTLINESVDTLMLTYFPAKKGAAITQDQAETMKEMILKAQSIGKVRFGNIANYDEGIKAITEIVEANQNIKTLEISADFNISRNSNISAYNLRKLTDVIRNHESISELVIDYDKMSLEKMQIISDVLNNGQLKTLEIKKANAGDKDIKGLFEKLKGNAALKRLDISDSHLSHESLYELAEVLKSTKVETLFCSNYARSRLGEDSKTVMAQEYISWITKSHRNNEESKDLSYESFLYENYILHYCASEVAGGVWNAATGLLGMVYSGNKTDNGDMNE